MTDKIISFFLARPENGFQPGILKPGFIFVFSAALIITRILSVPVETAGAAVDSQTLMSLINFERSKRNLPTLLVHNSLIAASAVKAQDMIDRDYFAHQNPDGNYIWGEIVSAGYTPYKILGENLAIDFSTSEGMVQAWIDSPTHRENLLHPDFVHQGLSARYGDYQGRYTNLTASLFGTPATAFSPPQPPPPAEPAEPPPAAAPKDETQVPETPVPPPEESAVVLEPETVPLVPESEEELPPAAPKEASAPLPKSSPRIQQVINQTSQSNTIKLVFTAFSIGFLLVLIIDSLIIYRKEGRTKRGYSSYHLFMFLLLVFVSLLVWWWR